MPAELNQQAEERYSLAGGNPASTSAETISSFATLVSTLTVLVGGSVVILASGSIALIALVTPLAHPPQVMFSI